MAIQQQQGTSNQSSQAKQQIASDSSSSEQMDRNEEAHQQGGQHQQQLPAGATANFSELQNNRIEEQQQQQQQQQNNENQQQQQQWGTSARHQPSENGVSGGGADQLQLKGNKGAQRTGQNNVRGLMTKCRGPNVRCKISISVKFKIFICLNVVNEKAKCRLGFEVPFSEYIFRQYTVLLVKSIGTYSTLIKLFIPVGP